VNGDQMWFNSVWYRKIGKRAFFEFAPQDMGTLSIVEGRLEFTGKLIALSGMKVIEANLVKIAGDFWNPWVKVVLESPNSRIQEAYFADGTYMGWSGIFGGTRRISEAIKRSSGLR
jgi:hypothetical protein